MKKLLLASLIITLSIVSFSQVEDDYSKFVREYNDGIRELKKEQDDFIARANAEFAEFLEKEWRLFEDFKTNELAMSTPKLKEIPTAKPAADADNKTGSEVRFTQVTRLPAVTNSTSVVKKLSSLVNDYVIKRRLGNDEHPTATKQQSYQNKVQPSHDSILKINFYGCMLDIPFSDRLRVHVAGTRENDAAKYFNRNLNMGKCDIERKLNLTKDIKVSLPYNSSHTAYLNDVPMTVFPIYFASPLSIEAQKTLSTEFTKLSKENTPYQLINIILHFVQTAFEYKTDDEQFGYEKYFYPEEVIAYPYSDCEDRAALFSWLVTTYTDAKVIGLQYEGHVATAVYFGDNFKTDGDGFIYGGKKYYVCDPTYINASVGMTMPQFAGKTPKVIKLKKSR